MDKKVNKIIETYVSSYKQDIKKKAISIGFNEQSKIEDLIEYVMEYERLVIPKEECIKQKRTKGPVSNVNRCLAIISTGGQCTRQRKQNCELCGTHTKGNTLGLVHPDDLEEPETYTLTVASIDINGIVYFVDDKNNLFNTEDIINEDDNPKIIGKATIENGVYKILSFNNDADADANADADADANK